MMKSDIDVKDDIYAHVKGSPLDLAVKGKLYRRSRPSESKGEDICISVLTNSNAQIQEVYVYVNIYVPDELVVHEVANMAVDGCQPCRANNRTPVSGIIAVRQYEEDEGRINELCHMAEELLSVGHGPGYRFNLLSQHVMPVNGKNEHFIANKLLYKMCNEKPY